MKIATSFKRIPAKNKVVLTNINYCKQKPDLLQVLLRELNILGNTSPIPGADQERERAPREAIGNREN